MASTFAADGSSLGRPSLSRSDSALSSSSTVSTASSSSSFAGAVSPLSIGGSPVKLGKFTQNVTMFDEKERCLFVKSRPFDWSPLPWTHTEVPFDWWLKRVDRELEGGRPRVDSDEKESEAEHGQNEYDVKARQVAGLQSMNTTSATVNSADAVQAADGESVDDDDDDDDDCEFYMCEEPEELEQEYDSRGRPILKLLTTFKGGYELDFTT